VYGGRVWRTSCIVSANWDEMRLKLQEKYLPVDYEEVLFEELLFLRQGTSTVEDYTNKFHELSIRSHISETERQTIARYRAGLREDIRKDLLIVRLVSVEEAYQLALRLEQQSRGSQIRRNVQYQVGGNPLGNHVGGSNRSLIMGWIVFHHKQHPKRVVGELTGRIGRARQ